MENNIFLSTSCFKSNSLLQILKYAEQYKFNAIEIGSGIDNCENVKELLAGYNGKLEFLLHNYSPPPRKQFLLNLSSPDPVNRERTLDFCIKNVELCHQFGIPFYSVHGGYTFEGQGEDLGNPFQLERPRISMDEALLLFIDSLSKLCCFAEKKGVSIAVENNALAQFALINGKNEIALCADITDYEMLFRSVPNKNLCILLDIGHLKISANMLGFDPLLFFKRFKNRVVACHIHDNDGLRDTHSLINEKFWFKECLSAGIKLILELKPQGIEVLKEQVDLVKKMSIREN